MSTRVKMSPLHPHPGWQPLESSRLTVCCPLLWPTSTGWLAVKEENMTSPVLPDGQCHCDKSYHFFVVPWNFSFSSRNVSSRFNSLCPFLCEICVPQIPCEPFSLWYIPTGPLLQIRFVFQHKCNLRTYLCFIFTSARNLFVAERVLSAE